jgi:hypothetical protein
MDDHKAKTFKFLGPGGIRCGCCLPVPRKGVKEFLRRVARRALKLDLHKEKGLRDE